MDEQVFFIKKIRAKSTSYSIILQNENGPCAIVAICNTLILCDTPMAQFIEEKSSVSSQELQVKLIEMLYNMDEVADDIVFSLVPRISEGLEVNPKLDGTFASSNELKIFEAFKIHLVHGWVLGKTECSQLDIADENLASTSYEEFCSDQFGDNPNDELKRFFETFSGQLTLTGYTELLSAIEPGVFAVLFWNNHFSTICQNEGRLCLLVTDLGYKEKHNICWEVLDISGAGMLLNPDFEESNSHIESDAQLAQQLASKYRSNQKGSIPQDPSNMSFQRTETDQRDHTDNHNIAGMNVSNSSLKNTSRKTSQKNGKSNNRKQKKQSKTEINCHIM